MNPKVEEDGGGGSGFIDPGQEGNFPWFAPRVCGEIGGDNHDGFEFRNRRIFCSEIGGHVLTPFLETCHLRIGEEVRRRFSEADGA